MSVNCLIILTTEEFLKVLSDLVEVEEDPGGVADEKDEDDAEEDERLPVVLTQLLRVRGGRSRAHQLKDKTKS